MAAHLVPSAYGEARMSNCDRCRWFVRERRDAVTGECHRRAPAPLETIYNAPPRGVQWPTVRLDNFCGEHEPLQTTNP